MSDLSAEQKRELLNAKDKELSTFVKHSVVDAASRQRNLTVCFVKIRWVVTFKDDGSLKARLVVQGLQTSNIQLLQPRPVDVVRFF